MTQHDNDQDHDLLIRVDTKLNEVINQLRVFAEYPAKVQVLEQRINAIEENQNQRISAVEENQKWSWRSIVGLILLFIGNVATFYFTHLPH